MASDRFKCGEEAGAEALSVHCMAHEPIVHRHQQSAALCGATNAHLEYSLEGRAGHGDVHGWRLRVCLRVLRRQGSVELRVNSAVAFEAVLWPVQESVGIVGQFETVPVENAV